MVDALRSAHRALHARGSVVDIHPTGSIATIEVDGVQAGKVDAGDASTRHNAATAAILQTVHDRLFEIESFREFTFYTYGDSAEELRDHVADSWRDARIDEDTVRRMRAALQTDARAKPRISERVRITKLTPRG